MEHYKCINDLFGYCKDRPRVLPKPSNRNPGEPYLSSGGRCSENLKKCGSFLTNTQKNALMPLKSRSTATESQKKGTKKKK